MFGFWLFMLCMNLMLPLTMIGFGVHFSKGAPKKINDLFGYRTPRSMKNTDTWEFAHRYCGRLWKKLGLIALLLSVIPLLLCMGKSTDIIGTVGAAVMLAQCAALVGAIFPVEAKLKKTFDENGRRR